MKVEDERLIQLPEQAAFRHLQLELIRRSSKEAGRDPLCQEERRGEERKWRGASGVQDREISKGGAR
jgi:hypothetical protein